MRRVVSDRLLDKHVFAALQKRTRNLVMGVGRSRNRRGID